MNASWTKEGIAKVEELWRAGKTGGQIAGIVGRTRNAVCGLMHRYRDRFPRRTLKTSSMGVPKTRAGHAPAQWSEEHIATARGLYGRGRTVRDIAMAVGRTPEAVSKYVANNRDIFPHRIKPAPANPWRAEVPRAVAMPEAIAAPNSAPVSFLKVTDRQCKYPLWPNDEKPGPDSPCCGANINFGDVYCRFHRRETRSAVYSARAA